VSSGGSGVGAVLGTILGAVIRGGVVGGDVDNCDPRTDGQHRRGGIIIGTRFPGSGRMGTGRSGSIGIPTSRIPLPRY
jgi:hypothetical protein